MTTVKSFKADVSTVRAHAWDVSFNSLYSGQLTLSTLLIKPKLQSRLSYSRHLAKVFFLQLLNFGSFLSCCLYTIAFISLPVVFIFGFISLNQGVLSSGLHPCCSTSVEQKITEASKCVDRDKLRGLQHMAKCITKLNVPPKTLMSSVIYYCTDPQQHGIYLFYMVTKQNLWMVMSSLHLFSNASWAMSIRTNQNACIIQLIVKFQIMHSVCMFTELPKVIKIRFFSYLFTFVVAIVLVIFWCCCCCCF